MGAGLVGGISLGAQVVRNVAGLPIRNLMLSGLREGEFEMLKPHLEHEQLEAGAYLLTKDVTPEFAYFLNAGVVSLVVETADQRSVAVGICGREDLVGLQSLCGIGELVNHAIMQAPGSAFRVRTEVLRELARQMPGFRETVNSRLSIRCMQMAQNNACNRLHSVKQRLARWLLTAHDRLDSDTLKTTHNSLARMVGSDRPSVSLAIAALQREETIRSRRGSIAFLKRTELEKYACECYSIWKKFNVELGLPVRL